MQVKRPATMCDFIAGMDPMSCLVGEVIDGKLHMTFTTVTNLIAEELKRDEP